MARHHRLIVCIVSCALSGFASAQSPLADARARPAERPSVPDVATAWFNLWGEQVGDDDTWLVRAAPELGEAESIVQNRAGRTARFRTVVELPLSDADRQQLRPSDLFEEFGRAGLRVFAVGATVQTAQARVAVVGVDVRGEQSSLFIPCVIAPADDLAATTRVVHSLLQAPAEASTGDATELQAADESEPLLSSGDEPATDDEAWLAADELAQAGMELGPAGGSSDLSLFWTMGLGFSLLFFAAPLAMRRYSLNRKFRVGGTASAASRWHARFDDDARTSRASTRRPTEARR